MTMRRHIVHATTLFLVALLVLMPRSAPAQTRLNYVNADIRDVIRSLGTVLGVNVLLSEDVPAERVTYTTAAPVPFEQVSAVLEAILESEGLVIVQRGPVAEVMPAQRAPATGPIHIGKELPRPAPLGLITQIVPLQFISAEEAMAVMGQLASPLARIEIVPRSNSLLITDLSSNVARYLELLRELDVRSEGEGGMRTYVYRLKHANAAALASTLGQIFGASVPAVDMPTPAQALADQSLSATLATFRQREQQSIEQRRANMQMPLQVAMPSPQDTAGGLAGDGGGGLVGQTTIVPDLATNALIIRTSPPNYPVLEETIAELDIRPAQVLLEVLVTEITLDRDLQYGINWSFFADSVGNRDATIAGRLGRDVSDSTFNLIDDFALRVVRLNSVDVRAVVRALATKANVQVLSTPHIVALNNEQARILVGSEVPFTGSVIRDITGGSDRITQYRNIGTELTIIPTINEDGYVSFRILQQVSDLTEQAIDGNPIFSTREAETSALVLNGQTVVIGGLIDEQSFDVESGVPLLKDIPLLGYLFKSTRKSRVRTELAIFVTPYVVMTDEDAAELLERERNRLENREAVDRALAPPDSAGRRN